MKSKWYVTFGKYLLMFLVFAMVLFPIYWIVSCSFRYQSDFMSPNPSLWGTGFTWDNYITVFTNTGFGRNIINSLIYTLGTIALSLVISSFAAYALTFFPRFRMAKYINIFMYLMQMMPSLVMTITFFLMFWKMGILNTYSSMILAYACGGTVTTVVVIMLSGYFGDIPRDLMESATIDGASTFKAFWKIIVPLAAPGLLCTAIYIFIIVWQEFPFAQNLLTDSNMYNVTVGLASFNHEHGKDWGGLMAAATVVMVPTLIMFVTIQNYFIDNLAGAVKE